jgi:hypothetical protein
MNADKTKLLIRVYPRSSAAIFAFLTVLTRGDLQDALNVVRRRDLAADERR